MKKLISVLLAALMLLCCAALAEEQAQEEAAPVFDPLDLTATFNGKSYTLPMPVEQFREAGINIEEYESPEEGGIKSSINANNGRNAFQITVHNVGGQDWVTGWVLRDAICMGANIGPFTVGETTHSQVYEIMGKPQNLMAEATHTASYSFYDGNVRWEMYFGNDAKIYYLSAYSNLPVNYGTEFSDLAGVQQENLPDATSMGFNEFILDGKFYGADSTVQDFIDNGWLLPVKYAPDQMAEPNRTVFEGYLYNGAGLIMVQVRNNSMTACKVSECRVTAVQLYDTDGIDLVLADGLTFGSSVADCEATLGAPLQIQEYQDSLVYSFKVLGSLGYDVLINENGVHAIAMVQLN